MRVQFEGHAYDPQTQGLAGDYDAYSGVQRMGESGRFGVNSGVPQTLG